MAKKATEPQDGKTLVIVESPAKARTIGKYLGPRFVVEASIGHVRDLPQGRKEVPEEFKDRAWANLGVDVEDAFRPIYIIPASKKAQVTKLKKLLKDSQSLFLATDEDREGEAISWHLCELLAPKVPVKRLVFHEITEEAIRDALANPRDVDERLVRAQETRRILDRLYGYEVSPLLWKKIGPGLSAGRVQSVAVRLIVERERERRGFVSATYWDAAATFSPSEGAERGLSFEAEWISIDDRKLPRGRDFDEKGRLKDPALLLLDEPGAGRLVERLRKADYRVSSVEEKPLSNRPAPPFTTSTLQQEANRKLGFTARRTMSVAQSLYENGHITYMRTDSTNLATVAVDAARDLVRELYGSDYLPREPRVYKSKVKNAQEAHEAIRPAGHPFEKPELLRPQLNDDEYRLFELIWKRTIASQMVDSRERGVTVGIGGGGAHFQAKGKSIEFAGFLRAYVEGSDDPAAELAGKERLLPTLAIGDCVELVRLEPQSHTTQPPPRFSEAALTRKLEEMGIGRPSTYASIIDTILAREYVFKRNNALVPTWVAFSVCRLLEENLASLVDYGFTAQMEDYLDAISRGEAEHLEYLRSFYYGDGRPGLKDSVQSNLRTIDARSVSMFEVGTPTEGARRDPIFLRVGRYGPFLEQGERETPNYRKASVPTDLPPDELSLAAALELLERGAQSEEPLGVDPESGRHVFLRLGRFGPYVQLGGGPGDSERPKNASLLKGMEPSGVSLDVALRLLALPRSLGKHPESGESVDVSNGRWGPYVRCGSETRSLPASLSPLDISFEQALGLLAQPKARGRGRSEPREPLKMLGESPATKAPIQLLDGRYGPYLTDGETNVSLPKGMPPDEVTFEKAVDMLAGKKASGGSKKAARRGRGGKAASPRKPRGKSS
ncbi:MAG: type I DNA topoisomerase [Planctomycetes bacterium]|nr:type I DNA topoisomerase [Planctomycetota bacterium]